VTEEQTTGLPLVADRSLCLLPTVVTGRQRSAMYDGASPCSTCCKMFWNIMSLRLWCCFRAIQKFAHAFVAVVAMVGWLSRHTVGWVTTSNADLIYTLCSFPVSTIHSHTYSASAEGLLLLLPGLTARILNAQFFCGR